MALTSAEIREFTAKSRVQIAAASKRSKAQEPRLRVLRLRLISHFDRIDAHLARTHSYLHGRYRGLAWAGGGTSLRDVYVAADRAGERSADAGDGQTPV